MPIPSFHPFSLPYYVFPFLFSFVLIYLFFFFLFFFADTNQTILFRCRNKLSQKGFKTNYIYNEVNWFSNIYMVKDQVLDPDHGLTAQEIGIRVSRIPFFYLIFHVASSKSFNFLRLFLLTSRTPFFNCQFLFSLCVLDIQHSKFAHDNKKMHLP